MNRKELICHRDREREKENRNSISKGIPQPQGEYSGSLALNFTLIAMLPADVLQGDNWKSPPGV